ncbi:MAG: hypothetical protein IKN17_09875 [Ruminococcus sp.]|nr:hypothetical protein [Ruminococcus sp.]
MLFIDTPMKVMNPEYERLGIEPINKTMRTEVGRIIGTEDLDSINGVISGMLAEREKYAAQIEKVRAAHLYNIGRSAELCGRYIIRSLNKKRGR